eukprot:COSAG04_NODE_3356_length_2896_cov_2.693600_2_plen_133_part_00
MSAATARSSPQSSRPVRSDMLLALLEECNPDASNIVAAYAVGKRRWPVLGGLLDQARRDFDDHNQRTRRERDPLELEDLGSARPARVLPDCDGPFAFLEHIHPVAKVSKPLRTRTRSEETGRAQNARGTAHL